MADQNSTIETTVVLDSTQAKQEIVKLGAVASDTTKSLEERTAAKNKQVEIQNKLAKQTIKAIEEEIKVLKTREGTEKEVAKLQEKLNKQRLAATKLAANGAKQQNKLNEKLEDSKDSMKKLDDATGGVISSFKAFLKNPIGLTLTALAAIFTALQKAVARSSEASEAFGKVGAKLSGIMNGFLAVLEPVVVFLGKGLLKALTEPKQAIIDFGKAILENVVNRFKAFLVLGDAVAAFFSGEFEKAAKLGLDATLQFASGITEGTKKLEEFATGAKVAYDKAAIASEKLANSEKQLLKNRQNLEKQQLIGQNLAEKQRQIRDDTSKSFAERIKANDELEKQLTKQFEIETKLAQQTLFLAQQKVKANGSQIENLQELGDAELKILEIEERIVGFRAEQLVETVALRDDQAKRAEEDAIKLAENAKLERDLQIEKRTQANDTAEAELDIEKDKFRSLYSIEVNALKRKRDDELKANRFSKKGRKAADKEFIASAEKLRKKLIEDEQAATNIIIEQKKQIELDSIIATEEEKVALNIMFDNEKLAREREFEGVRLEQELFLLEERRAAELLELENSETQKAEIIARFELEKRESDLKIQDDAIKNSVLAGKEEAKIEKAKAKTKVDFANFATEGIISAAGEAFGIQQELAVSEMLMKAPAAIAGSYQKAAEIYAPPLSFAMGTLGATSVVAPIIKGLYDIKKARFPGKKKSSGSGGSIAAPTGGTAPNIESIGSISANNAARLGIDSSLGSNASATAANNVSGESSGNVVFSEDKYSDFQKQVEFKEDKTTL